MYELDEQAESAVRRHVGDTAGPEQSAVGLMLHYMPFSPGITRHQQPWVTSGSMVHSPYRDIVAAVEKLLGPDGHVAAEALRRALRDEHREHFDQALLKAYGPDRPQPNVLEDDTRALPTTQAHRVREYESRRLKEFHPLSEQDDRLEAVHVAVVKATKEVNTATEQLARYAAFQSGDKAAYTNPIPEPVALPATADTPGRAFGDLLSTLDELADREVPAGADGIPMLQDQLSTIGQKLNVARVSLERILTPAGGPPAAARRAADRALRRTADPVVPDGQAAGPATARPVRPGHAGPQRDAQPDSSPPNPTRRT